MTFTRATKILLYPNQEQNQQLYKIAGACRYVYNWGIDTNDREYAEFKQGVSDARPTYLSLSAELTQLRKSDGYEWLREVDLNTLQHSLRNADTAYQNFFKRGYKHPAHKKRGDKDHFYVINRNRRIVDNYFYVPKMKTPIRMAELPRFNGKILSYVISREGDKWFLSVLQQFDYDPRPVCQNPDAVVGVDVGSTHPATCSDGTVLDFPDKVKELESHYNELKRELDRSRYGSKDRARISNKLRAIRSRITNIKRDAIEKFTTAIAQKYGTVVVETLDIKGMLRTSKGHNMSRGIHDACMYIIQRRLDQKVQRFVKANRFYPSTQICSRCGVRHKLTLKERVYRCPSCGLELDRDLNAAINLANYISGQGMPKVSCG